MATPDKEPLADRIRRLQESASKLARAPAEQKPKEPLKAEFDRVKAGIEELHRRLDDITPRIAAQRQPQPQPSRQSTQPSFFEAIAKWFKGIRTSYRTYKDNQRKLWESREKARLDKEHMEWERAVAEEHRRAHDPVEIKKREREAKIAAIEAESAAIKPVQPPKKSERLSEAKRVARETDWFSENLPGFFVLMIVAPMLLRAVGQNGVLNPPTAIFLFFVIIVGLLVGVRAHHYSDAHQRYLRAKSRDEDRKWAEEDAAWANYEAALKQWEQNKQERLLALDALQTDTDGVTNIGRKVIDELNL